MDLRSPPGTEPLSRTHYTTILTQEIYCQNYILDVGIKGSYLTFLFIGKDIQKLIQVKVLRIALLSPLLKRTHSSVRSSHTWPTGELTGTFCQVTVAHTVVTVESQPLSRSLTLLYVSRPQRQTAVSLTTAVPSRDDYIGVWQTHMFCFLPNNLLLNGTERSTPEADHHTDVSQHAPENNVLSQTSSRSEGTPSNLFSNTTHIVTLSSLTLLSSYIIKLHFSVHLLVCLSIM